MHDCYYLKIYSLPKKLTHLQLGQYFRQPNVENILPSGLKHLSIDGAYPHSININKLPKKMTLKMIDYSPVF